MGPSHAHSQPATEPATTHRRADGAATTGRGGPRPPETAALTLLRAAPAMDLTVATVSPQDVAAHSSDASSSVSPGSRSSSSLSSERDPPSSPVSAETEEVSRAGEDVVKRPDHKKQKHKKHRKRHRHKHKHHGKKKKQKGDDDKLDRLCVVVPLGLHGCASRVRLLMLIMLRVRMYSSRSGLGMMLATSPEYVASRSDKKPAKKAKLSPHLKPAVVSPPVQLSSTSVRACIMASRARVCVIRLCGEPSTKLARLYRRSLCCSTGTSG
jgi:hypothetical protein